MKLLYEKFLKKKNKYKTKLNKKFIYKNKKKEIKIILNNETTK
jgi:hypothetical protein